MSLQVWLPLNGDLRNNGLCNCKISSIGNSNGIIFNDNWSCKFNNAAILLTNPPILRSNYSISFWIEYDATRTNTQCIFCCRKSKTTNKHITILLNNDKIRYNSVSTNADSNYSIPSDKNGKWIHIILTSNNLHRYLYIDGNLVETISADQFNNEDVEGIQYASIGNILNDNSNDYINDSASGNKLFVSLRDFRIYDHCLSVKEIKELSKGLILHYPFNNNGLGYCNPNLLTGTADGTGWSKSGFDEEEKALYRTNNTTSENFIKLIKNNIVSVGKTYTLSADIKTNDLVDSVDIFVYDKNTKSIYRRLGIQSIDNKWHHHKLTFTVAENNQADWSVVNIRFDNNRTKVEGQDSILYVKNIKLEEGSIDTPWIPNEADPEYLESLLDTSIVNDTSGFGTYGIVNGDLSYDADSPIYRSSIKSSADGNYIQGAKTLPNFDNMTLSVWVYPTKSNGYAIFSDRKSNLAIGLNDSTNPEIVVGTNNYGGNIPRKILPTTYNINNWHHIVLVKTASNTFDLYIDNVLTTNSSNKSALTQDSDYFQIMHRLRNADTTAVLYFYQGKLSDLRIYATALSEDDIKELYESKISVDKDGNAFIRDMVEE